MAAPVVHFEIHASDPQRALAFYRDVFGWSDNSAPGMEQRYWLLFPSGQAPVQGQPYGGPGIAGGMLLRQGDRAAATAAPNAFVCIVTVEDLDDAHERVQRHGGSIVQAPTEIAGVGRVFYGRDTEGNHFGVLQPASM